MGADGPLRRIEIIFDLSIASCSLGECAGAAVQLPGVSCTKIPNKLLARIRVLIIAGVNYLFNHAVHQPTPLVLYSSRGIEYNRLRGSCRVFAVNRRSERRCPCSTLVRSGRCQRATQQIEIGAQQLHEQFELAFQPPITACHTQAESRRAKVAKRKQDTASSAAAWKGERKARRSLVRRIQGAHAGGHGRTDVALTL